MDTYGEILFIGKCNLRCFYCLGNEMSKLQKTVNDSSYRHFYEWNNFESYISNLKNNNINKIFLSSTIAEPLLYPYIDDLTNYLIDDGFSVGIRTNGVLLNSHISTILKMDSEISISINSLNSKTNKLICGVDYSIDIDSILSIFESFNKKCRISIVVNRYNKNEILDIIQELSNYKSIEYIQLRKIYKYKEYDFFDIDISEYENLKKEIALKFDKCGNYYESQIYDIFGLNVSLWDNVFNKESIVSYNYFTDGKMSSDNLLVRIYEE